MRSEQPLPIAPGARMRPNPVKRQLRQGGVAIGVAHDDYAGGDIVAKMTTANEEGLVIALVETALGIRNVEEIAGVDGVDVLWVGHFDLTNSMGIPGQFEHPDFRQAVGAV